VTRLFDDSDIEPREHMAPAIEAVELTLRERASGTAVAQPRTRLEAGANALALAPGALEGMGVAGLRVYPIHGDEQLVAVWGLEAGRLETLFLGSTLGLLRTGAIGGVAARTLVGAPAAPIRVALIGAGPQAFMQLLALTSVFEVDHARLHRRDLAALEATSRRWSNQLECEVRPSPTARDAVIDADVVILATGSTSPVVEPEWIAPNAYVASLGPKRRGATEIPPGLLDLAGRIVSDFPEQHSEDPEHIGHGRTVEDLATAFAEGDAPKPGVTVFLSHGLPGTEVAVAHLLARRLGGDTGPVG
jgi:ornithine cyclodeaminase